LRTSERACQEENRTRDLKDWQEEEGIRLGVGVRGKGVLVEVGSKGAVEGVRSAFRFWVMLSSIEERERRRKSVWRISLTP
jgi:hypothetical protein